MQLTNLAISTIATPPSPPTTGGTIVVSTGQGDRFPDPTTSGTFPVTIWPTAIGPDPTNAEIALCTARSGDTLTITRAQEGSSARSIISGDQIMLAITANLWNTTANASTVALWAVGDGR